MCYISTEQLWEEQVAIIMEFWAIFYGDRRISCKLRESIAVQRVLAQGFAMHNALSTLPWLHRHRARRVGGKIAHYWSSSAERFSHLNPKKTFCALINVLWWKRSDVKSGVNRFCWIAVVMHSGSKKHFTSTSIVFDLISEVTSWKAKRKGQVKTSSEI